MDGDGLRASYRKIHLYDSFGYRESDRLLAGARTPTTLEVAGVTVGLMTCYDLRFPELARELSRAGRPSSSSPVGLGRRPAQAHHWRTLVTARAVENVSWVAAVGQSGAPLHRPLAARGPARGRRGWSRPGTTTRSSSAEVDSPSCSREAREENPSLLNRRDDRALERPRAGHGPAGGPGNLPAMARLPKSVDIQAEMVANVLQVYVGPGDAVAPGDTVVLLESMKMEIPVLSEHGGTVPR